MLPLRDLQMRFDSALFDDATDAVAPWIRGCDNGADSRATCDLP
ncbi:MAG: hypothetical protein QOI59_3605 [Gammaproteobacteria bacterium]|jgi:hypothetical protein|nr:hypothetical protein [Gammaproteobacteria bacterium]